MTAQFEDARRHAPATLRNREPILQVLRRVLPKSGLVLEVASGTGEHAVYFARHLPGIEWQPTDVDQGSLDCIAAWSDAEGSPNVRAPVLLDVHQERWPVQSADAVACINMIHIAPWSACEALMVGAARILPEDGVLFLYGPYRRNGQHTAPSNAQFDASLRARDPRWGVRDLEEVVRAADAVGFGLQEIVEMPANNLSVVFRTRRVD